MKRWYKSKVVWFNALIAAGTALEASTSLLQPHVPFNVYFALTILVPAGNIVLRYYTTTAIKSDPN